MDFRSVGTMALNAFQFFSRRMAAGWTLGIGLVLTAALGWELNREALELDRQRLARRVVEIQSQLDSRLEKSEMLLHNLRDYLTWSGERSEAGFQRWCYENGHTINCRWLAGIALATNRSLARWPANVPKTPRTWSADEWETLRATAIGHRIECDLALTSSLTNTLRFVADYELRGDARDRSAFSKTVGSSRLGMSEYRTVMEDARGIGVVGTSLLVPLFKPEVNGLIAEVMEGRYTNWSSRATICWLHFTSVIVAPVDYNFLAWAISEDSPADVAVEIFSSTNQVAETWLNKSGSMPRAADPEFRPYLSHRQRWPMYGQRFSIYFHTTPLFEAQSPRRLARVAMAAGLALTLLAAVLVAVSTRARLQQEQLAGQISEARDALAAAQRERNKISRDLHDGTIQSLYAIQLGLGHTVEKLAADPSRAGSGLSAVRRELDIVIAEIRQFITAEAEAEPAAGLSAVLGALRERMPSGAATRIDVRCDPTADGRLTANQSVQLANIAREALSNSLRHAAAKRIEIHLNSEPEAVALTVTDDGAGFDPKAPPRTGLGLGGMKARAQELRGTIEIRSAPGEGTRVTVRVPVAREVDDVSGTGRADKEGGD